MKILQVHPWNVSVGEARAIQDRMASRVSKSDAIPENARFVVGTDISPPDASGMARGAAVVMSLPELQIVEVKCVVDRPGFPYLPGLLSFRESPLVLGALEKLTTRPDFLLVDGQGIAHPRRFGLACHLGFLADIPAIGCAKSILVGKHGHLDNEQGSQALMEHKGEVVGQPSAPGLESILYSSPLATRLTCHRRAGGSWPAVVDTGCRSLRDWPTWQPPAGYQNRGLR